MIHVENKGTLRFYLIFSFPSNYHLNFLELSWAWSNNLMIVDFKVKKGSNLWVLAWVSSATQIPRIKDNHEQTIFGDRWGDQPEHSFFNDKTSGLMHIFQINYSSTNGILHVVVRLLHFFIVCTSSFRLAWYTIFHDQPPFEQLLHVSFFFWIDEIWTKFSNITQQVDH